MWDKPWTVSVNLDFSVFDNDRPDLFGWRMPPNWSFNLLARAEAGQRYTPLTYVGRDRGTLRGDYYSEIGPWKSTVNIRFNKFWKFGSDRAPDLYLEVRNIFNHKNYRRVNPYTGEGYKLGDYNPELDRPAGTIRRSDYQVSTDSEDYAKGVVNPSYIENPRHA